MERHILPLGEDAVSIPSGREAARHGGVPVVDNEETGTGEVHNLAEELQETQIIATTASQLGRFGQNG